MMVTGIGASDGTLLLAVSLLVQQQQGKMLRQDLMMMVAGLKVRMTQMTWCSCNTAAGTGLRVPSSIVP